MAAALRLKYCAMLRFDHPASFSSVSCPFSQVYTANLVIVWAVDITQLIPFKNASERHCDEAHFWLNGYVNKQNCRIWSEANSQVYVETPLHPEKLTVWCALWAGGILLQKR
ncbi:hypothetical protein TNCV_2269621 [Trichonephila clavipes]|nr:hypothetical protein TNCV_2269621 [Trichonephila clavipes]